MGKEKIKSKNKKILIISSLISIVIITIVCVIVFVLKNKDSKKDNDSLTYYTNFNYSGFFVEYFKAGIGDCTLIHFDNGKVMLIDTGSSESTLSEVQQVFERINTRKIDYLVLTHPDDAHIGNTTKLLEDYEIDTCYIPDLKDDSPFTAFNNIKQELNKKDAKLVISKTGNKFSEGDADVYFLYPMPSNEKDSIYDDICLKETPTDEHIDNLSPVIFIEYNERRFLFAGDCRSEVLESVIDKENVGFYNQLFRENLYLENVDFMLMPNSGMASSNSEKIINYFNPSNAIISAEGSGGENISSAVIDRLNSANKDVNILLTQQVGCVRVSIDEAGEINIITDKDLNS